MSKRSFVVFFAVLLMGAAAVAHAATPAPDVTLSLFRAVRLSNSSITLTFKTDESAIGQIRYAQPGGSEIQLTDAAPQMDHLFTLTELDPNHGYSFTLSATTEDKGSNEYVILIDPNSIGVTGSSIVPGVQVTAPDGSIVSTMLSASTTPGHPKPIAPWWAFALLFIAVVGGWVGYSIYKRRKIRASGTSTSI